VQGVLAARIDLLTPIEKSVLQSAAVVGRTFWNGAVQELLEPGPGAVELDEILVRLEDRGLVHAHTGSSIVGEGESSFRHVLIKDVAYESLPRRERAKAHAMVAGWIERRTNEREREFAELLTHHYDRAYRSLSAEVRADPDEIERLRAKAFGFGVVAATEAGNKLALEQAERFGSTALSLAATPSERARALETLGMTYIHDYRGDKAWRSFKEAIDLISDQPPASEDAGSPDLARLCALALEIARRAPGTMRHRISPEEEERYLEIGLAAAGPGDSEERARLLTVSSFGQVSTSEEDLRRAIDTGEQAAAMAERLGRVDLESAALDGITSAHHSTGRYGAMEDPIRRRLELAPKLSDPYEVGDIYAMASWWALNTGRYRESLDLADRGLAQAMPRSPVYALYCLDFRAGAHFRLGDWDGVLADVAVADEILGDRRESPPGVAPMHLAMAAFIHDARGDGETADRYLDLVRWLEQAEDTVDPVLTHWQARLLSRQGRSDEARALLERPDVVNDLRGRDEVLEAWCEVISEDGSWGEAAEVADRAGRHAGWAGLPPLALYATRLEGRAAAAWGDSPRAVERLTAAMIGFEELEAVWEAAVSRLDVAEVLVASGEGDAGHDLTEEAAAVFARLGSTRELGRAERLLGR